MGGRGRVRCAAFAPAKTARKRGRDRGKLAAIILCFEVGCVALALSYSSPFSLAERRRRRRDDGTTGRRLSPFFKSDDVKIKRQHRQTAPAIVPLGIGDHDLVEHYFPTTDDDSLP